MYTYSCCSLDGHVSSTIRIDVDPAGVRTFGLIDSICNMALVLSGSSILLIHQSYRTLPQLRRHPMGNILRHIMTYQASEPISARLFFLFCAAFVCSLGAAISSPELGKRDDTLPARVPYVFPTPGTDPVSTTAAANVLHRRVLLKTPSDSRCR
jgi:hypothetical protein